MPFTVSFDETKARISPSDGCQGPSRDIWSSPFTLGAPSVVSAASGFCFASSTTFRSSSSSSLCLIFNRSKSSSWPFFKTAIACSCSVVRLCRIWFLPSVSFLVKLFFIALVRFSRISSISLTRAVCRASNSARTASTCSATCSATDLEPSSSGALAMEALTLAAVRSFSASCWTRARSSRSCSNCCSASPLEEIFACCAAECERATSVSEASTRACNWF